MRNSINRRYLSVGFADLANFSKLIDEFGLEGAVELLQSAFIAAGDVIIKHDGTIHKYVGDKMLFTIPDPRSAVILAQEIHACVGLEDSRSKLRFHVSIATGDVLFTRIGHPSLVVEDILGQVVNTAYLNLREARHRSEGYVLCPETARYMVKV